MRPILKGYSHNSPPSNSNLHRPSTSCPRLDDHHEDDDDHAGGDYDSFGLHCLYCRDDAAVAAAHNENFLHHRRRHHYPRPCEKKLYINKLYLHQTILRREIVVNTAFLNIHMNVQANLFKNVCPTIITVHGVIATAPAANNNYFIPSLLGGYVFYS